MPTVIISDAVRDAIGRATARQVEAGHGIPRAAQCWKCGGAVPIAGAAPGTVALSVLAFNGPGGALLTITLWSHPPCSGSRMVTVAEFEASPAAHVESPVPAEDLGIFVDGERRPANG